MSVLPELSDDTSLPVTSEIFGRVLAAGIPVPRLYRALGHAPEMLRAWTDFAWPLRTKAKVSRVLRELMIIRVAQMTHNEYEVGVHKVMARVAGVSEARLDALPDWRSSDEFSEVEREVLQLAEEMASGPGGKPETIEALRSRFSAAEVVELVLSASFYVCVGRVVSSLQIGPEEDNTLKLL